MNTLDEGVRRYIDTKRAVLRNMGRIQNELARLQYVEPRGVAEGFALQRIQMILDDPFTDHGPSPSP